MNPNVTYTYGTLSTKNIVSDPEYQRPVDPKRVKMIAEHFNPLKVNPLKVSHRSGKYYVFDGQHTMRVLILRNGGDDVMADCIIYEGMTQQDEAEMFARQSEFIKRPEKSAEMKALYAAGDVEIIELKKAIESVGFTFDFSTSKMTNRIICCGQVLKIFRKTKQSDFIHILELIRNSWHGLPDSLRKEIVGGVWIFYSQYKEDIDTNTAAAKFSRLNPVEILRDGGGFKNLPGDTKYAYVLAQKYNSNQRKNKLDLKKLMQ